jgi:predicted nuclease of predicted toxin-antitoxin system
MHKLLFDQNLSYRIIKELEHLFPGSKHVGRLKLDKADDMSIWQYAKENNFHIVTKDTDFNNINTLYGFPPKVIWIHAGNIPTSSIIDLLKKKNEVIYAFLNNDNAGILEFT